MIINANQLLFLFFCNFQDLGMKPCKTHGVIPISVTNTMRHQFVVCFKMDDTDLTCICDMYIDAGDKKMSATFSPKNKFDVFNLILPCNQDPDVIQTTYDTLRNELSKDTFNVKYELTFDELAALHSRFVDGNKEIPTKMVHVGIQ